MKFCASLVLTILLLMNPMASTASAKISEKGPKGIIFWDYTAPFEAKFVVEKYSGPVTSNASICAWVTYTRMKTNKFSEGYSKETATSQGCALQLSLNRGLSAEIPVPLYYDGVHGLISVDSIRYYVESNMASGDVTAVARTSIQSISMSESKLSIQLPLK